MSDNENGENLNDEFDKCTLEDKKDIKKEPCQDATPNGFVADFRLMPHQEAARDWMIDREAQEPSGGILGLAHGQGKTAIVIALILDQKIKCASNDKKFEQKSPTLIIVPKRIIYQWYDEFKDRLEENALSVYLYYDDEFSEARKNISASELQKYDVVLTTYRNVPVKEKDETGEKVSKQVLQNIKWTRIVLDEAHNIRDSNTKKSTAIATLASKNRWCVTAAPFQNSEWDICNLILFLGNKPFGENVKGPEKTPENLKKLKESTMELFRGNNLVFNSIINTGELSANEKKAYDIIEDAHKRFCKKGQSLKLLAMLQQASIHFHNLAPEEPLKKAMDKFMDEEEKFKEEEKSFNMAEKNFETACSDDEKQAFESAKTTFETAKEKFTKATEEYTFSKETLKNVAKLAKNGQFPKIGQFPEIFDIKHPNARITKTINIIQEVLMKKEKV